MRIYFPIIFSLFFSLLVTYLAGKVLKLYNTKILVIDADPETRSSKKITMSVKYGFRVRYRDVLKSSIDLNERLITAEKTEALDAVKTALLTQKIIYPIMLNGEYVKQMIASTRVFNPKKMHGQNEGTYEWIHGSRKDHYFLATSYLLIGRQILVHA